MNLRKRLTLATGGLGATVLVVACIFGKDALVEQWYALKLKTGDREEQRAAAARLVEMGSKRPESWYLRELESGFDDDRRIAIRQLGELRSVAALPVLLDLFREKNRERSFFRDDHVVREALVKIGEPAAPSLAELSGHHLESIRSAARNVLGEMRARRDSDSGRARIQTSSHPGDGSSRVVRDPKRGRY